MEGSTPLLVFVVIAFAVGMFVWHFSRAEAILQRWARDNGYEIVSKEYRWFRRGPFFWWTSKGQEVFYVTIRTMDGRHRRGWVRCGGWLLGVFSDQADVQWDE